MRSPNELDEVELKELFAFFHSFTDGISFTQKVSDAYIQRKEESATQVYDKTSSYYIHGEDVHEMCEEVYTTREIFAKAIWHSVQQYMKMRGLEMVPEPVRDYHGRD